MLNANRPGAMRVGRASKVVGLGFIFTAFFASAGGLAQAAPATTPPAPIADEQPLTAEYRQYTWHSGDPAVRMISKDEGFCFLSEVAGHFAGGGEAVSVYIGEDGFWYLGGQAAQQVRAKAYSVKFSRKVIASVVPQPDPAAEAWQQALRVLSKDANKSVADVAAREVSAFPSEPGDVLKLAEAWNDVISKLSVEHRPAVESHLLHLYQITLGRLSGAPLDQALARLQQLRLVLASDRLNDLASWHVNWGKWSITPDGAIEGHGNSQLILERALPPNCFVEFHANPVDGMRTRILFPGTNIYIGNEGFTHQLDVFGGDARRTIPHPYSNGDEMKLGIKFVGKTFEFYVNGELQGKGTRTAVPAALGIAISAGDDFDEGVTRFWGFKVSAVQ